MERRVPECSINWCCPYRSDLCREKCSGERTPKDDYMIVKGDDCFLCEEGADHYTRYSIPEKTRGLLLAFDRGDPIKYGEYILEAPNNVVHHCKMPES